MAKIIGIIHTSFKGDDGTLISGDTIYTSEPIDPKRGDGESAERFFMSNAKLSTLGFTPTVNQEVEIFYNRFGKIATLKLVDDVIEIE